MSGIMMMTGYPGGRPAKVGIAMRPFQLRKMRLETPAPSSVEWLAQVLAEINRPFGTEIMVRDGSAHVVLG